MKALYYDVHQPQLARYSADTMARFRKGRDFERTYKETYPEGIDISARLRGGIGQYPVLTAALLRGEGEVTLFEAGFLYDEVLVLADVVCKHADDTVDVYEVKSGCAVTDTFRNDASVQQYVVRHALASIQPPNLFSEGLRLSHFHLLYNDGNGGFVAEDQLAAAQQREEAIAANIARFKAVVRGEEPRVAMSPHCDHPYECPYKAHCLVFKN